MLRDGDAVLRIVNKDGAWAGDTHQCARIWRMMPRRKSKANTHSERKSHDARIWCRLPISYLDAVFQVRVDAEQPNCGRDKWSKESMIDQTIHKAHIGNERHTESESCHVRIVNCGSRPHHFKSQPAGKKRQRVSSAEQDKTKQTNTQTRTHGDQVLDQRSDGALGEGARRGV